MSVFSSIMNKIFHHGAAASPGSAGSSSGAAAQQPSSGSASAPSSSMASNAAGSGSSGTVDVEAILTSMASNAGQTLDWRKSIVDLMKLLNLDSSLASRKELAQELHYSGDTNDSATMNVWLHKQVMQKLAENGGKVPDSLKG